MDDLEFKRLIEKYQQGLLTDEEKRLVDEWFASIGNQQHDEQWTPSRERKLGERIISSIGVEENRPVLISDRAPSRRHLRMAYRIAASVLIVACAYVGWQYSIEQSDPPSMETVASTTGGVKKVVLPDHSIVWLKGNSSLTYPQSFDGTARRVSLSGEALFEVTRNPSFPFVIECGDLLTTVLGTSFNIRTIDRDIEVLVLTGKVALTSKTDEKGIVVLPNEKALYSTTKKQIAKVQPAAPERETREVIKGTEYAMNFENTGMAEVIRRIEGKYDVHIVAEDQTLKNCLITADFTDESLERTLDMISQALNISYNRTQREIVLRGAGCPGE